MKCEFEVVDPADFYKVGAVISARLTLKGELRQVSATCIRTENDKLDIWFESAMKIWHSGVHIDRFRPDVPSPDLSNVYLFPLVRTTRNANFEALRRPAWQSFTAETYNRISSFMYTVCGLVLSRLLARPHYF